MCLCVDVLYFSCLEIFIFLNPKIQVFYPSWKILSHRLSIFSSPPPYMRFFTFLLHFSYMYIGPHSLSSVPLDLCVSFFVFLCCSLYFLQLISVCYLVMALHFIFSDHISNFSKFSLVLIQISWSFLSFLFLLVFFFNFIFCSLSFKTLILHSVSYFSVRSTWRPNWTSAGCFHFLLFSWYPASFMCLNSMCSVD